MINKVAIIGKPRKITNKKAFDIKLRMILGGKHKLEIERLSTLDKSLNKLLNNKYSIVLIHEDSVKKVKIGEQIHEYPQIIYRSIVQIRTGLIKFKGKEVRSANKSTPIIVLYSKLNEENVARYGSVGANISIDYKKDSFVELLMQTLDQYL